jgi:alpha-D-ribose 1-methylphosphonate 5-triphosphate synthase subunit PhnH
MDTSSLLAPGFDSPVYDSISVFRAVADAMAHPGAIQHVPARPPAPAPLMPAAAALCLTLLDFETPLWLQRPQREVTEYLKFHCGCPLTAEPRHAAFALITDIASMPALAAFNSGDPEYPDRSATLFVQVASLSNATGVRLSGPGLQHPAQLDVAGFSAACWRDLQSTRAAFPCGVDVVFVWGERIAALPRTTAVAC